MTKHEPSIDRLTRSHKNTFTSVRLDRLVEFRDDPDWVRQALVSGYARLVPQWRGKSLLDRAEPERQVVYLEPAIGTAKEAPPTLLGRDSRYFYFAQSVDDRQHDDLLASRPGAKFFDLRTA